MKKILVSLITVLVVVCCCLSISAEEITPKQINEEYLTKLKEKVDKAKANYDEAKEEYEKADNQVKTDLKDIADLQEALEASMPENAQALKEARDSAQNVLTEAETNLNNAKADVKAREDELTSTYGETINDKRTELEEKKYELAQIENNFIETAGTYEDLKTQVSDAEALLIILASDVQEKESNLETANQELEKAKANLETIKADKEMLEMLGVYEEMISGQEEIIAEKETAVSNATLKLEESQNEYNTQDTALIALKASYTEAESAFDDAKTAYETNTLSIEISALEKEINEMEEALNNDEALNNLKEDLNNKQETYNIALENYNTANDAYEEATLGASAYQILIDSIKNESLIPHQNALSSLKADMEEKQAVYEELNKEYESLYISYKKASEDLDLIINSFMEDYPEEKLAEYTEDTVKVYKAALESAKAVQLGLDDKNLESIIKVTSALDNAANNLKLKDTKTDDSKKEDSKSDSKPESKEISKSCKEAYGEGWIWSEAKKECVYTITNTGVKGK